MILNRIFKTYTFRFAVGYVFTISLCASFISALIYWAISFDYFNRVQEGIRLELEAATASYQASGIEGFEKRVKKRTSPDRRDRYFFALADTNKKVLAGNLSQWPAFNAYVDGWFTFEKNLFDWQDNKPQDFVGLSVVLDNGYQVLVARNYEDVGQRIELVAGMLIYTTLVTVILGVIGGAFISAGMIKRIDSLNRSISNIMHGNLSERLKVTTRGGEIDQLATQLNMMLDRIEDSMNDVREVSNNIAHDLRTPLTRLRNKLSLLSAQSTPENRDLIREMLHESDQLLSIFSSLLRIAQVEAGTQKSNFTHVDLTQIFVDVVELYEPLASVNGKSLEIVKSDACHIQGDKDLLFQMLVNLLDNAIKYTPEGGAIVAGLYVEPDCLRIVFVDNGPGIPVQKYEKVFQRFYRVEESRGVQPGNGLGLSLVKAVAVLHGGTITLSDSRHYFPDSATSGLQVTIEIPIETL